MSRQAVIQALGGLDPAQRALLDLSLNRGFTDEQIANLLGNADSDEVGRMRTAALSDLSVEAGIAGPDSTEETERLLRTASDQQWLGAGDGVEPAPEPEPELEPDPEPETKPEPETRPERGAEPERAAIPLHAARASEKERSRPGPWIAGLSLVALVIGLVIVVSGGGEDSPDQSAEPSTVNGEPAGPSGGTTGTTGGPGEETGSPSTPSPGEGPVALEPLGPQSGRGSVQVEVRSRNGQRRVSVRIRNLPPPDSHYRLWLYSSLIKSEPLGAAGSGNAKITAVLPANALDYRYLEISEESSAKDSQHSGRSLYRVALENLLQ